MLPSYLLFPVSVFFKFSIYYGFTENSIQLNDPDKYEDFSCDDCNTDGFIYNNGYDHKDNNEMYDIISPFVFTVNEFKQTSSSK